VVRCKSYDNDEAGCLLRVALYANGSMAVCDWIGGDRGCEPRHPAFTCAPPPPAQPPPAPPLPRCSALLAGRSNARLSDSYCPAFKEDQAKCAAHYVQEAGAGSPKLCVHDPAKAPACFAGEALACAADTVMAAAQQPSQQSGKAAPVAAAAPAAAAPAAAAPVAGAWVAGTPKEACTPLEGSPDIDWLDCKSWCGPFDGGSHADHCLLCKCKGCPYCRQHPPPTRRRLLQAGVGRGRAADPNRTSA
jgi:hypothetical protein